MLSAPSARFNAGIVVMKVGVRYSDPFTFAALRNFLGGLALLGLVAARGGSRVSASNMPIA